MSHNDAEPRMAEEMNYAEIFNLIIAVWKFSLLSRQLVAAQLPDEKLLLSFEGPVLGTTLSEPL